MGTIILPNAVKRKPDYLYYVDGKGNVCEAVMAHGGRKKKEKEEKVKAESEEETAFEKI